MNGRYEGYLLVTRQAVGMSMNKVANNTLNLVP
jgi:hypothetical protein